MLTDGLLLIRPRDQFIYNYTCTLTQKWRLQSYQVKRMILLSKADASIL